MKIMFSILGEGRGHMTQAMAVKEMVEKAGHQVTSIALGMAHYREVPAFFASAMKTPITKISTPEFSYKNNRSVDMPASVAGIVRNLPNLWRSVRQIKDLVTESKPDVIISFFEPLTAIYSRIWSDRPPIVALAHQYMFGHPAYVRHPAKPLDQWAMKWYIRMVGGRSTKIALSLYEARDLPERNLVVCPPILRPQLFTLQSNPNGNFILVYLLNHGYADEIIDWHKKNPQTPIHCFYDKPEAPEDFQYDDTLTFHRLDGEKFLRMMAECKYVACTAGFESLAESVWLGKPLFLMPVKNHIEQEVNAVDATRMGVAVADTHFNLDRLQELPPRLDNTVYRAWVQRASSIVLETLEYAAAKKEETSSEFIRLKPKESEAG